jgi:hypothetical protein
MPRLLPVKNSPSWVLDAVLLREAATKKKDNRIRFLKRLCKLEN